MKVPSIVIVDDDQAMCRVLTVRCKYLGMQVRTAADAMLGLMMIHKHPPDCIIFDITMPAGNGVSACEMLSTDPRLARIPVIIHTGLSEASIARRCAALGAHFVQKSPDSWSRIRSIIVQHCDVDVPKHDDDLLEIEQCIDPKGENV